MKCLEEEDKEAPTDKLQQLAENREKTKERTTAIKDDVQVLVPGITLNFAGLDTHWKIVEKTQTNTANLVYEKAPSMVSSNDVTVNVRSLIHMKRFPNQSLGVLSFTSMAIFKAPGGEAELKRDEPELYTYCDYQAAFEDWSVNPVINLRKGEKPVNIGGAAGYCYYVDCENRYDKAKLPTGHKDRNVYISLALHKLYILQYKKDTYIICIKGEYTDRNLDRADENFEYAIYATEDAAKVVEQLQFTD